MTLIRPLTNKTAKRRYLHDVERLKSPCDHCPNTDTCRTGKACKRFRHFVERGTISLMHDTTACDEIYRTIFEGRRQ